MQLVPRLGRAAGRTGMVRLTKGNETFLSIAHSRRSKPRTSAFGPKCRSPSAAISTTESSAKPAPTRSREFSAPDTHLMRGEVGSFTLDTLVNAEKLRDLRE